MKNTITLINNSTGEEFEFDLIECTRGPKAIDFGKLFERTGIFSYDPGYASTAGCRSRQRVPVRFPNGGTR